MASEIRLPEDQEGDAVLEGSAAVLRRQPVLVVLALAAALVSTGVPALSTEIPSVSTELWPVADALDGLAAVPAWILLWTLVGGLAAAFVDQLERRGATSLREGVATLGRRAGTVAAVGLGYALAVLVGLVCLVLPGLYLALRLAFAVPSCVVEGRGVRESFERSLELARPSLRRLAVLGGFFFGAGLFLSIQSSLMLSAADVQDPFVADLLGSLLFAGAALAWNLAVAVLFVQARSAEDAIGDDSDATRDADSVGDDSSDDSSDDGTAATS